MLGSRWPHPYIDDLSFPWLRWRKVDRISCLPRTPVKIKTKKVQHPVLWITDDPTPNVIMPWIAQGLEKEKFCCNCTCTCASFNDNKGNSVIYSVALNKRLMWPQALKVFGPIKYSDNNLVLKGSLHLLYFLFLQVCTVLCTSSFTLPLLFTSPSELILYPSSCHVSLLFAILFHSPFFCQLVWSVTPLGKVKKRCFQDSAWSVPGQWSLTSTSFLPFHPILTFLCVQSILRGSFFQGNLSFTSSPSFPALHILLCCLCRPLISSTFARDTFLCSVAL